MVLIINGITDQNHSGMVETMSIKKKSSYFSIDQILGRKEEMEKDEYKIIEDADSIEEVFTMQKVNETCNEKKENKQTPSYTAIIAQAILSSEEKKLPLGDVYDYIAENFPDFLKKGQGWRNCVRHNLSLSECFIKAGRARNGRGNYWGIHPRYIKNFSKGDYRKRRASHRPRNSSYGSSFIDYCRPYNNYILANEYAIKPNYLMTAKSSFAMDNILAVESKKYPSPIEISNFHYDQRKIITRCAPPTLYPHHPTTYYPNKELISPRSNEKISFISNLACSCPRCPPIDQLRRK